ncbi:hypothetical protein GCM10010170_072330 [Dactylosporangium salmoneum]|uniref:Uncharacterized protein n=1 Tax=Dactylosporangium salmoneum TaxID=53361 RepID=A0ABN3H711_9ACTN
MTTVELCLNVRHHLDPVDHKIGDQAVDLGVLHDHADHPRSTQVGFAEFCTGEVLIVEASHADRLGPTAHATPGSPAISSLWNVMASLSPGSRKPMCVHVINADRLSAAA